MAIMDRLQSRAVLPGLGAAFGYIGGFTLGGHAPLAIFGLVWGCLAANVAPRVARWAAGSPARPDLPLLVMFPLSWLVLGGAILGHLAGPTPASFLNLLKQPGYGLFFYGIHGPFEWILVPWALMANWSCPKRRSQLVLIAMVFYAGRSASAIYFAPRAIAWGAQPAMAQLMSDSVALWIRLDIIRVILQDLTTAVLLFMVLHGPAMSKVRQTANAPPVQSGAQDDKSAAGAVP